MMNNKRSGNFFHKGHLNEEGIALYADALTTNNQNSLPEMILEHVEQCSECKKKILFINQVLEQESYISKSKVHSLSGYPEKRRLTAGNYLRIASVLLILLSIGGVSYYFFKIRTNEESANSAVKILKDTIAQIPYYINSENRKETINNAVSIDSFLNSKNMQKEYDILAANYKESAFFESLIASSYRSQDMEVLEPQVGKIYSTNDSIIFRLKGEISEPLVIKLYNNSSKKILQLDNITINTGFLAKKLSRGLFYWKLEMGDELVFVGKIKIIE